MRFHGLLLARHTDKRPERSYEGKVITLRHNSRWSADAFQVGRTAWWIWPCPQTRACRSGERHPEGVDEGCLRQPPKDLRKYLQISAYFCS
jgi:hypothetical protein